MKVRQSKQYYSMPEHLIFYMPQRYKLSYQVKQKVALCSKSQSWISNKSKPYCICMLPVTRTTRRKRTSSQNKNSPSITENISQSIKLLWISFYFCIENKTSINPKQSLKDVPWRAGHEWYPGFDPQSYKKKISLDIC